jgi:hypothetical protein
MFAVAAVLRIEVFIKRSDLLRRKLLIKQVERSGQLAFANHVIFEAGWCRALAHAS